MAIITRNSNYAETFLILVMNHNESNKNTWGEKVKNKPNLEQEKKKDVRILLSNLRIKNVPISSSRYSQLHYNFEPKRMM